MAHLAQINVARAIAPLDDPRMSDFVRSLDALNAIAESAPGFVWRLKGEDGVPSSYLRPFDDPLLLVNLSVWDSIDALRAFTYGRPHAAMLRDRRRWFLPQEGPTIALWWIAAGAIPTITEGVARLRDLEAHGPGADAFTFQQAFPPPQTWR